MTTNQTTKGAWQPADNVAGIAPRDPGEMPLFIGCLVFSLLVYAAIEMLLIRWVTTHPYAIIPILIIAAAVTFVSFAIRAAFVAHVRGNGMMVWPDQLGRLYEAVQTVAQRMDMPMPQLYVVQFGGVREAVVKIFVGSRILVLSSKLLEDCGEGAELDMAIGRELAHFRFHHIPWRFWLFPSIILPLLYPAWRRATEYTADRYGLLACGDFAAAERKLYIEAAGGRLGRSVAPEPYHGQVAESGGFWTTLRYLLGGEPNISWRVSKLANLRPDRREPAPAPRRSILATILCAFVPGASACGPPRGGVGSLAVVAIIAILVTVLVPVIAQTFEQFDQALATIDLRMISMATINYATEHEGLLPPSLEVLRKTYDLPADLFRSRDGEETHYLVEELIQSGRLSPDRLPSLMMSRPDTTVLFYRRVGARYCVAFADGHAVIVRGFEFEYFKESSIRELAARGERDF